MLRVWQPGPLSYHDFCDALEVISNKRYKFRPLQRVEGGVLCTKRNGAVAIDDAGRQHMTARMQWNGSWLAAYGTPRGSKKTPVLRAPESDGVHSVIFETTGMDPWTKEERNYIQTLFCCVLGWPLVRSWRTA